MTYETTLRRGQFDKTLRIETTIPLGLGRRELHVTTMKGSRGLRCSVQCVEMDPDGRSFRFIVFGDFNKLLVTDPKERATEKNLRRMHAEGMASIEVTLAEARAFYAAKAEPLAA